MKKILLTSILAGFITVPLMAHADESGYDYDNGKLSISGDRDNVRSDRSGDSREDLLKTKARKGQVRDKSRQHHWKK